MATSSLGSAQLGLLVLGSAAGANVSVQADDSAQALDAGTAVVSGNLDVTLSDSASSLDDSSVAASISVSDSLIFLDSFAPSGAAFYTLNDPFLSTEAVDIGPQAADTVAASEVGSIGVLPSESGVGTDTVTNAASLVGSDQAVGSDTPSLLTTFLSADSLVGIDVASFIDITPGCDATSGVLQATTQRLGPEYFLPHWTTANAERSGIAFNLCQWGAEREVQWKAQTARAVAGKYLGSAKTLEPLYEWRVNFVPPLEQEMVVTFTVNTISGSLNATARRAVSQFDYDTAVDPVWYQSARDRVVRLRNLFMHTIQRYRAGSVYTICGPGVNAYLGMVPDTGVFYRRSPANVWEWISPESDRFSPGQVVLPGSGTWQIAFGSAVDLAGLQLSGTCVFTWSGGQSISLPLIFTPLTNLFDGYGSLMGLPRVRRRMLESNYSYKGRLLALAQAPADTTLEGVIRGVGSQFGLVSKLLWDGVSAVTLDQSGTQNITSIKVVEFKKYYEISEQLLPVSGNTVYYSTFTDWRQNSIVFVNGLPTASYTLAGNKVTFSTPVTGRVEAVYSVQTYQPVLNAAGYIRSIAPGQGVVSGNYTVLITRVVNAHPADDLSYQKSTLLDASGLPNLLFSDIATQLTENNPTTFGRARWGGNASWFEATDEKPSISRLPVPFDTET